MKRICTVIILNFLTIIFNPPSFTKIMINFAFSSSRILRIIKQIKSRLLLIFFSFRTRSVCTNEFTLAWQWHDIYIIVLCSVQKYI